MDDASRKRSVCAQLVEAGHTREEADIIYDVAKEAAETAMAAALAVVQASAEPLHTSALMVTAKMLSATCDEFLRKALLETLVREATR
jgi:hypothetical protein